MSLFAHETWFTDMTPSDWSFAFEAATLALLGLAVVVTLAVPAQLVGIPMGDLEFVRLAGAIEVLFGLLVISGALPQACVLIAGIRFNASLWFFGNTELVGHLPIYGAMLVLLVCGSDPQLRPAVSALWPWGRPRLGPTRPAAETGA